MAVVPFIEPDMDRGLPNFHCSLLLVQLLPQHLGSCFNKNATTACMLHAAVLSLDQQTK